MLGYVRGHLIEKTPDTVILDVGGVGYELTVPASTYCALPSMGALTHVYVHTHVREDAIRLFGFATLFDRKVFESCISVSGIGPKVALTLLASWTGEQLCRVFAESRLALLCNVPGVGQKTAERLLLELKPKLTKLLQNKDAYVSQAGGILEAKPSEGLFEAGAVDGEWGPVGSGYVTGAARKGQGGAVKEAVLAAKELDLRVLEDLRSALSNIGYKEKQVNSVLKDLEDGIVSGRAARLDFDVEFRKILRTFSGHLVKESEASA
jgi:holliday junction DNA helicase RuvA